MVKMLKLGMVSSFHPHSMCKRVGRGHGKNWRHFVYKLDNLFRSIRVSDENSSVTRALQCFLNLFELRTSFVFSMQHSKRRHQFPTCSDIICCFSVIYLIVQYAAFNFQKKINNAEKKKLYKKFVGALPSGPPDLGCANAGPEGPAGSQGSAP